MAALVLALSALVGAAGSAVAMFTNGVFYLAFFLTIVSSLAPDLAVAYSARQERPFDWEILQEVEVLMDSKAAKLQGPSGIVRSLSKHGRTNSTVQDEVAPILPSKPGPTTSASGSGAYGSLY